MTGARLPANGEVSRETAARLADYAGLVRKWTQRINLIAPSTVATLEDRHIADSLQLVGCAPPAAAIWADLGSGAGFPGLVVAIAWAERPEPGNVILVESDRRKCAFLRAAIRELRLSNVEVLNDRIESLPPIGADVVSARALGQLDLLLGFARRHLAPDGVALFPKGRQVNDEIDAARRNWRFDLETIPSQTSAEATILRIRNIDLV